MNERWLPIVGFEGRFEVSDLGRVRSVARFVPSPRHGPLAKRFVLSRVLRAHTWGAQYPGLVLIADDGTKVRKMVHQLVAEAFIPNPHRYTYVNHIDGDKSNPSAVNLEWVTQSMNLRHAHETGLRATGSAHHFAKLKRDAGGRCLPREEFA